MAAMAETLLALRDVEFAFRTGGFRLEVPALDIAAGTTNACIGQSGSGKSTLLQLMAGIVAARRGRIALDGVDWADLSETARRLRRITRVGLVFQEFELLEHLDVRENILLPYFVQRGLRLDAAARARMAKLAAAAGIGALLDRRPRALSQGERQRVALCRALVTEPALLLADEPTGNLDPDTARAVLDLMLAQVRARGATLVMVTHDHGLLDAFERVIALEPGADRATVAAVRRVSRAEA
jgi:putative ABC transport system ATP-binding protein